MGRIAVSGCRETAAAKSDSTHFWRLGLGTHEMDMTSVNTRKQAGRASCDAIVNPPMIYREVVVVLVLAMVAVAVIAETIELS